jgi:putative Mg2+ transporter-C (MgtC) family protein
MPSPPIVSMHWDFMQLAVYFGPKVFFAVVCGALVGIERELKGKPAGMKTNMLICVGAALYTSISILISGINAPQGTYGDPGRVTAQIVSGIGFLGGGTIIQARGTILGLTTAATIWVVAAIGVCVGIGHPDIALASSLVVLLILVGTSFFEDRILGRSLRFACEIVVDDPDGRVRQAINQALARNDLLLDDFDIAARGGLSLIAMKYSGHRGNHKKFVLDLWSTPGIREVKQT